MNHHALPFAAHQHPDCATFAEIEAHCTRSYSATNELAEERDHDNQDDVGPCGAVIQEAKVSFETGEGEVLLWRRNESEIKTSLEGRVRTIGRNKIVTRSSIFSKSAIEKPLSLGMISPAMKPPKMACTPITSVKKALTKTKSKVIVIMDMVG